MKHQQLLRIDKIYSDNIYLLSKNSYDNKYEFEICGSTKNIYKVSIYKYSKTIYCNCPDGKSYAKKNGLICKHACFILLKVLKIPNQDLFFNILLLDSEQLDYIETKLESIQFVENDFINMEYLDKFKNLIPNDLKNIIKDDDEKICPICYDDLSDIENKKVNHQCTCCLKIYHNSCIQKWTTIGNNTCPYCRTVLKNVNNYKSLE